MDYTMKALLEKIRNILRSRRTRQMLTRSVSVVAAVVVFITTYALVLPAITMEQNAFCGIPEHQHTDSCYEERLVCGIPEGQGHHHDASCYEKFLICGLEVHVHSPECYQQGSRGLAFADGGEAVSTASGAAGQSDVLFGTDGSEYDPDTLVTDGSAAGEEGMEGSASGESVSGQPSAEETDVDKTAPEESGAEGVDAEEGAAGAAAPEGLEGAEGPEGFEAGEAASRENAPGGSDSETASENVSENETVTAPAGDTSGEAASEDAAAAASTAASTASDQGTAAAAQELKGTEDASFKSGTFIVEGEGYKITLEYTEKAEIPENAELSVREITAETDREAYEACLEQAGQQVAADEKTSVDRKASRFFDIEILERNTDSEGNEVIRKIEPSAPVSVNIQIIEEQFLELLVLHFAEEGVEQLDAEVKEGLVQEQEGDRDKKSTGKESEPVGTATEFSFEAESFSIYAVVYTVDFHWEVDGKEYEFSIPGGGFVSLEHLVEMLGIGTSDASTENGTEEVEITAENAADNKVGNTDANSKFGEDTQIPTGIPAAYDEAIRLNEEGVSETAKKFVADVQSVDFSSPELVWTGKADKESTVGGLKEANGLEVEYSADLTKEQTAEINAQKVEAGDWALISVQPFVTEENLIVTMKTGEVFTIKMTDAQISKLFISDRGESWKITVIYDEKAGIPEGADLEVTEITHDDDDYDSYLKQSREELGLDQPGISDEDTDAAVDTEAGADLTDPEKTTDLIGERDEDNSQEIASDGQSVSLPLVEDVSSRDISFVRFFDIHIVYEGKTIEPRTPVTVKVEYVEMPVPEESADVKAVHFARSGVELIDAAVGGNNREIVFEQSSFSVTGTVITTNQYWQPLGTSGKYVMYASSGGKFYAIRHDRSLTEVTVANGKLTFENLTSLSDLEQYLWDYEAAYRDNAWRHYLSYQTGGTRYYIDPQAANDISTTQRDLSRTGDNKIYSNNNYLSISGGNIVGQQHSQNGVQIQFANAFEVDVERYVTVHFVDRKGTELKGVNYTGGKSAVTPNNDGTYKILYNWHGQTGNVNLKTDFSLPGYSYANSHLAGTRQGTELTYEGLVIDAKLTENGNTLYYSTDRGVNRKFDPLIDHDLNAALQVYHTDGDGTEVDYSPADAESKDIYVVLDPIRAGSGGSGSGAGSGSGSAGGDIDVNAPDFLKTMEPNGDGTYKISLSVTGKAKNQTTNPKANVVLVVDTSSSMDGAASGASGNKSRLDVMKEALSGVDGISKELFANNGTNGRDDDTVEVAMITFDGGVVTSDDWMKTKTAFDTRVNGLTRASLHRGTDWEDALKEAYTLASDKMRAQPEEATFVIFFTDGEPSQYTQFHGAGDYNENNPNHNESGYKRWYSYFLCREAAKDEARAIVNAGIRLYGIFAFNSGGEYAATGESGSAMLENTIGYAYNMSAVPSNTYFYNAGNANALTTAFTNILKSINESIGAKNVHMHDDITGLTSVGISTVSSGSGDQYSGFKYTRSGGAYGTGQEWAEAPSATFVDTGTPDPDHPERNEKYVEWDLGDSMMEDDVTYTVSFTVWPSQEAYNMVADLNNGIRTWDSLSVDEKNQVLENPAGSGKYELRTNPPSAENYNEITYDKVRSEILDSLPAGAQYDEPVTDGNVTTVYTRNTDGTVTKTETTHSTTAFNDPEKNMKLEDTISKVMKKWNADLQLRQLVEYLYDTESGDPREIKIPFVLNQDEDIYGNPIMLGWDQAGTGTGYTWSDTTSEVTIGENTYPIGTEWTKRFDIAVGLILDRENAILHGLDVDHDDGKYTKVTYQNEDYYMLEPGHDYYINEPAVAQLLGYRFDFSTRRYHPMLVNGVLKSVTIENGVVTDVYPGSTHALGALTGENTLRGGINLHKILLDENGDPIPESTQVDDEFTFTITLKNTATITKSTLNPDGSISTSTTTNVFVGEDIPWYSVNGNYYHDDDGNYYAEAGEGRSGNILYTSDGQTATAELSIKRTDTVRIANVPAGTEFTIVETPRSDYDFVRASRGVSGTTIYDKMVTVPTIDGEIVPNKEMNVAFTNKKANKYRIGILKKDVADNLPLSGAVFELYGNNYYVKDGQGQPTSTINEDAEPLQENLTSNANGEIDLGELISGIYYLVETHAPDGYDQTSPIKITVDENSTITKEVEGVNLPLYVTYHQEGYSGSDNYDGIGISVSTVQTADGTVTNYSYTLTVMNSPGVALPYTGGPGTRIFTIFGTILIAGAGMLLLKRRRTIN